MKTEKQPLFDKLVSIDNLILAVENSAKHKLKRARVRIALEHKYQVAYRLRALLIAGKLKLPHHEGVLINDGVERKQRIIVKPHYIYELILQWAVVQVLRPFIMKGMYEWSCGSIANRGAIYGKRHLEKYIKQNPKNIKYAAKADIYHFFQSVDIDILKSIFKQRIRDKRMLDVINLILDCSVIKINGKEVNIGLPIGFYTSQYFANFYLQGLDHFIKEKLKIKCYIRYVDDFVMLHQNKKNLHKALVFLQQYLSILRLKIKGNYQVYRFIYEKNNREYGRVIDFMGFKFYRNRVVLRKSIMLKATRIAKRMKNKALNWYESTQIISYLGWFKHTNTFKVYEKYIQPYINVGECKKVVSIHSKRHRRNENDINVEEFRKLRKTA